ncbi:MAG: hypothetical protein LKI53_03715 [Bacteroidales bacterium]|jgi:hypothetical protein|nr:hypothetical protein [Bacteroidales bacterium]
MKHKLIYIIIAIIALPISLPAQNFSGNSPRKTGEQCSGPRNQKLTFNAIKAKKIAFFTEVLELTPREAEKFWPVYNEYWKKRISLHRQSLLDIKTLNDAASGNGEISDAQLMKLADKYYDDTEAETRFEREYFKKFTEVLPLRKAVRLFNTEEDFRRYLIRELRKK